MYASAPLLSSRQKGSCVMNYGKLIFEMFLILEKEWPEDGKPFGIFVLSVYSNGHIRTCPVTGKRYTTLRAARVGLKRHTACVARAKAAWIKSRGL